MYGVVDNVSVWCHGSRELNGVVDHMECMVSWIM